MIWLPAGGAKSPPRPRRSRRGEHYIRMEGKETYRFATRTLASTALTPSRRPAAARRHLAVHPAPGEHPDHRGGREGLDLPMSKFFVNLDKYGNTSAASVPIALAEAVNEGRVASATHRDGRVRGGVHVRRGGDGVDRRPVAGALGDAAVDPASVRVRPPVGLGLGRSDPAALAEILRRPVAPGIEIPLDDVVPGEPERAKHPVG
jgi:hypothetical protein